MISTLRKELTENAYLVGEDIDRFFQQREYDIRILSQADVLEQDNIAPIIKYLTEIVHEGIYLDDIDVIDRTGAIIASSDIQNEKSFPCHSF